ncbi:T9SS type A sorting domain-containing protein [Seonamhaeicola sp. MEBiC1930]|uniref:T9SS type A sorting domain-containing protein n=1 Tax=Seonamhaeicola sp. MEBiC01930 TaxID=2976768 RepID=UPI003252E3EC
MKITITVFFLMFFTAFVFGQDQETSSAYRIIRSNVGSGGSSVTINTRKGKYMVSQSVGQASVVGTYFNKGYYLKQGYQQDAYKISIEKEVSGNLNAEVYPNPFKESVSVAFKEKISNNIFVTVFDINGRQVHEKEYNISPLIQLNLSKISSGTYFLKVSSGSKLFNAKLIKK